jgi:hypothetical protein
MDWGDIVEIRCREEVDEEFAALDVLGTNSYHPTEDYYECYPCDYQSDEDDYEDMEGGYAGLDMDYGDMDCGW